MRLPALCSLALALAACGRLGYDEVADAGGDGPAEVDAPDAPIDGPDPGVLLNCSVPTQLADFGDTGGTSAVNFAVDAARTDAGFLVAWSAGNGNTWVTALGVNPGPRVAVLQAMQHLVFEHGRGLSISAMGNAAMVGVDDPDGDGTHLFALDELGFERSSSKYIDGHHAFGHDFVIAEAEFDLFFATASTGSANALFTRDHDIHPRTGPHPSFAVTSESAALVPMGDHTYTLITGNSTNCHVGMADDALVPMGSSQTLDMTCHNASLVKSTTSSKIVAAWNCDNNDVWATGGDPTGTLPAYHAVSETTTQPASNPRIAAAAAGVWYGWQVGTDRLARALLNDDSNVITGGEPMVVYQSPNLKAYDLVTNGTYGFLFWLEVEAGATRLYTMKLCPP